MNLSRLRVDVLPILGDNFCFVIHDGRSAAVVDPGEDLPVLDHIKRHRLQLDFILLTHYHHDHTAGVGGLLRYFGAKVLGPAPAPFDLNGKLSGGTTFRILNAECIVLDTPGHALPHVSYYFPSLGWLFCGDCLFGAGCGRVVAGQAPAMWQSLQLLARLPAETDVFFGHEYTLSNLAFAASVDPGNPEIQARRLRVEKILSSGGPSVPSKLREELDTNPFLRCEVPEIRSRLGLEQAVLEDVFAALRRAKDVF